MNKFRWLHFSDLHFSANDSFIMTHARKSLYSFLKENNMSCDYLFLTGDIADKGDYTQSIISINELINSISFNGNCENIFWAVGNHDIERGIALRDKVIKKIRENSSPQEAYQRILCNNESIEKKILCDIGMARYYKNYKAITGFDFSNENINGHRFVSGINDFNLIILNTCITSCDENDTSKLLIAEPKLINLFENIDKNKPTIVLGHHGKDFFYPEEYDNLSILFDERVDLYLCGHSHILGYSRFDNARNDIHQLTCGGGKIDGYSKLIFMYGEYENGVFKIIPYSFSEKGTREWDVDYSLHRRLSKNQSSFNISRLTNQKSTSSYKNHYTYKETLEVKNDERRYQEKYNELLSSIAKGDCYYLKLIKEVEDYINEKLRNEFFSEKSDILEKHRKGLVLSDKEKEMLISKHEMYRITVEYSSMVDKDTARTIFHENGAIIYCPKERTVQEQLVVIAHETAHILQQFGFFEPSFVDSQSQVHFEMQANEFANRILTMRNERNIHYFQNE